MRRFFIVMLVLLPASLLAAGTAGLPNDLLDDLEEAPQQSSSATKLVSTNWLRAVKAALPAQYWNRDLTVEQLTNLLCQESQKHNAAAEDLWAIAVLARSHSPDEAQAGLQILQDSADQGFGPAMANLGIEYETGEYTATNYDLAFHWFSLAAAAGNADGELQLGACYHYGLGTAPDLTKTVRYYRLAALQTNYVAMKSLGYLLMNGLGTHKDPEAAKYWFTRAATEGRNRRAMYDLGVYYQTKFPDTNAMNEAFHWYQRSANLGDAMACLALAGCYGNGWGTETNLTSYREWIFNAATLGATEAQYLMGVAYRTGDGVPTNMDASLIWYKSAAAKNHPAALYDLAIYYLKDEDHGSIDLANEYMIRAAKAGHREAQFQCAMSCFRGDVGPPDFERGKQWLAESASNGWARAEMTLFELYYNGLAPGPGLPRYPKDRTEAIKWLRRAAEHGNLEAQGGLGLMLIQGMGMEQNSWEAAKWLRSAAQHGDPMAQDSLGFAMIHGDLGVTDLIQAAMWLQLAKSHWPNPRTERNVDVNLSNALAMLTPDQQLEVSRRVEQFRPLPTPAIDPLVKDWNLNPDYLQEDGRFGH